MEDSKLSSQANNIYYLNVLKITAILAVIVLHIACYYLDNSPIGCSKWWIANIYMSPLRFCVPIFLMISGRLLLDRRNEPLNIFFRKRFLKVVVPLIAWIIIYYFFNIYWNKGNFQVSVLLNVILTGKGIPLVTHLWFLYMLLGLYLATPVIRIFVQNASKTHIYYFLFLWLGFFGLSPYLKSFWNLRCSVHDTIFNSYLGYFVLGYALKDVKIENRAVYLRLFVVSAIITALGTYYKSIETNRVNNLFFYDSSPTIILMSIVLFLFFKANNTYSAKKAAVVNNIATKVYGIYLIHQLIMFLIKNNVFGTIINGYRLHPVVGIPITASFVAIISFIAVSIIKKVPIVKYILP